MRHQDRKQQWDKDSVSRKMERERLQSVMEPAKDKKTKKNGKTEVTWHGSVRFPVCVKQKKQKKRVHNSKHTLKVWGGSQHNAHIKKKRPHRSNGLTLGVFWGAKYKKIQWTGPIKRKAAIIKTHLNVTELSIKCISKNRKKAKKIIIKGPIIPILNLEVMLLLGNSKIIHQISHIWSWGWINYNQPPGYNDQTKSCIHYSFHFAWTAFYYFNLPQFHKNTIPTLVSFKITAIIWTAMSNTAVTEPYDVMMWTTYTWNVPDCLTSHDSDWQRQN